MKTFDKSQGKLKIVHFHRCPQDTDSAIDKVFDIPAIREELLLFGDIRRIGLDLGDGGEAILLLRLLLLFKIREVGSGLIGILTAGMYVDEALIGGERVDGSGLQELIAWGCAPGQQRDQERR